MGNDVKRIMSFPESCAPPTKKCIIKKNSCAGCKKIIFNSNTVFVFLLGPVFGQRPICSIISCLIIGAIFPSQDRALFVLPNIAPTNNIIFTVIQRDRCNHNHCNNYCYHPLFVTDTYSGHFPSSQTQYQDFIKHSNTFVG